MNNRLQNLTDNALLLIAVRVFQVIDNLMSDPRDGYQPYGWDWPTFHMIYPRKYNAWRRLSTEAKRRGLSPKIERWTDAKGKRHAKLAA